MSQHGRNHWIKLYIEMNHDPKIGLLTDDLKWRFTSVLLLAGEVDDNGFLPEIADMAWGLRTSPETLAGQMRTLAGRGLVELRVHPDGDERWFVSKFAERQAPSTNAERQKQWRKRNATNADNAANATVTKSYAKVTPEAEAEAEAEAERESARAPAPTVVRSVADRTPSGFRAKNGYHPPTDKLIPGDDEPEMVSAAPAAVRLIWRVTTNWPPLDLHDWLAEAMGDAPDEQIFRRVWLEWRKRGYKPTNYEGLIEWYREAISAPNWQAPQFNGNGRQTAKPAAPVIPAMKELTPGSGVY